MNKLIIIATITSWLTIWGMGAWAFAFYEILRNGEVTFHEPNTVILITEFTIAIVLALVGLVALILVIRLLRRGGNAYQK